jgi:hypothetical protein
MHTSRSSPALLQLIIRVILHRYESRPSRRHDIHNPAGQTAQPDPVLRGVLVTDTKLPKVVYNQYASGCLLLTFTPHPRRRIRHDDFESRAQPKKLDVPIDLLQLRLASSSQYPCFARITDDSKSVARSGDDGFDTHTLKPAHDLQARRTWLVTLERVYFEKQRHDAPREHKGAGFCSVELEIGEGKERVCQRCTSGCLEQICERIKVEQSDAICSSVTTVNRRLAHLEMCRYRPARSSPRLDMYGLSSSQPDRELYHLALGSLLVGPRRAPCAASACRARR